MKIRKTNMLPRPLLTLVCLCDNDEMVAAGKPTAKGFSKFFCETCHSTLWLSSIGFLSADAAHKIMER